MKTLKFREDPRQDAFYNELRSRVQNYLQINGFDGLATVQLWLKAGLYLAIYGALYGAILWGKGAPSTTLWCWAGLGFCGILLGLNVSHDAAHDSLSRHKWLNKWLYYLTFNTLGANAYLWQLRHVQSHHLFPNVDGCDADIDNNPFIRLSPYQPLRWYHRWQHWYAPVLYPFYTLIWVFVKDFLILGKKQLANLRNIRHPLGEVIGFWVAKVLYVFCFLVLPVWVGGRAVGEVLTGFVLMHFVASYTFIFGLIASHFAAGRAFPKVGDDGCLDWTWSRHQVATSLDYHATRRWANWLFGGFNAHVAHHLFPTLSHVHYPQISEFIAELAPRYHLPYQNTTLPGAIVAHFQYLQQMGQGRAGNAGQSQPPP